MTPHIEDRLLTIDEAAEVLRTTKDYLYRHHKDLPFTVRLSPRQLRFSSKGIERYIEEMQHARHGTLGT
jgi:excisionase family DNA binding protein